MKHLINHPFLPHVFLILLVVLTLISLVWLGFILLCPGQWSQLVDQENEFWVRKGMISRDASDKIRRFEKGAGQKYLLAFAVLLSVFGLLGYFVLSHR